MATPQFRSPLTSKLGKENLGRMMLGLVLQTSQVLSVHLPKLACIDLVFLFFSMFAIFAANENPSFVNNMYHPYPNEIEIVKFKKQPVIPGCPILDIISWCIVEQHIFSSTACIYINYIYNYYVYGHLIQFIANLGFYFKKKNQEVLSCPKICEALQDIDKKPVLIREMIFLKVLYKDAMRSGERSLKGPSIQLCLIQVVIWCNMGISEVMVDPQSSPVHLY